MKKERKNIQIIPAIDIIDGHCVRLTHGDYSKKTIYHTDPLEVAKEFEAAGIKRLHMVDLDGAKEGKVLNWKVLEKVSLNTNLSIDFGGGVKTRNDVEKILNCGADFVTLGSIAVKDPSNLSAWLDDFPPESFLLGADVRNEKLTINGWREQTDIDVFSFIQKWKAQGIKNIFCTDVSKDGALQGPATELYRSIVEKFTDLNFIASGGVSDVNDILLLQEAGCSGVIVGKAIYEGKIQMDQLKPFL